MNRVSLSPLIALVLACACPALAQDAAIVTSAPGVVTVDASSLTTVLPLDMPWRFQSSDNPRFADPAYDDSAWPLLAPGDDVLLAGAHVPNILNGQDWVRLHLHILNPSQPLAINLTSIRNKTPYAVFANGKLIGESRGFGTGAMFESPSFLVRLPQTADVLVAIHFDYPGQGVFHYFPVERIEIGQSAPLAEHISLALYSQFEGNELVTVFIAVLYFSAIPFSLLLLAAQREHSEYIWFALFCMFSAIDLVFLPMRTAGLIPHSDWASNVFLITDSGGEIACIGFVAALAGIRRLGLTRALQAYVLVCPILLVFHQIKLGEISGVLDNFFWLLYVTYTLFFAYRRGRTECGLLFFPLVCLPLSFLLVQTQNLFPDLMGSPWRVHIRGVGVGQNEVAWLAVLAGLVAVVVYRFFRVSKDEQAAAAELEAARTVQQLLIPATQPATPGFTVESVYLPARQVGGDFFLVLPSEDSTDHSLLAIVGDVSGKGLQAAMVVSTIIGGLRMQISRQPAEVLANLNRMLVGHVSGFATCCATLIQADGRMQIANAGNPSPYSAGEEIPTLPGLPLGMVADAEYEETSYRLGEGKSLMFVSDGVIEASAVGGREMFGFDRTQRISTESAEAVANAACDFGAGAPQGDDITVLTIRLR